MPRWADACRGAIQGPGADGALCGGEGDRTPDLVNAIHALSQLSYAPVLVAARWVLMLQRGKLAAAPRRVKQKSCRISLYITSLYITTQRRMPITRLRQRESAASIDSLGGVTA